MFGKKTDNPPASQYNIQVETIPSDFYGGANPVIRFKTVEKEVKLGDGPAVISPAEKKLLDKSTAAGVKSHPASFLANKKFLWGAGAALSVLFLAGATWYYWSQAIGSKPVVAVAPPQIVTSAPPVAVEPVTPETEPASLPEEVVPLPATAEAGIDFPPLLLSDSADMDNDGVTDLAEDAFRTDPGMPDTDDDKYPDDLEIYHLYNPAGYAPRKIIDAGLIKDYFNPSFSYSVYYPADWAAASIDATSRDVLFSALNGENIELRVFDLGAGETFADWFSAYVPGERQSALSDFQSVFGQEGRMRSDELVYYFDDGVRVYVLLYHPVNPEFVGYRTVIKMMARSFRLPGAVENISAPIEERGAVEETLAPATAAGSQVLMEPEI